MAAPARRKILTPLAGAVQDWLANTSYANPLALIYEGELAGAWVYYGLRGDSKAKAPVAFPGTPAGDLAIQLGVTPFELAGWEGLALSYALGELPERKMPLAADLLEAGKVCTKSAGRLCACAKGGARVWAILHKARVWEFLHKVGVWEIPHKVGGGAKFHKPRVCAKIHKGLRLGKDSQGLTLGKEFTRLEGVRFFTSLEFGQRFTSLERVRDFTSLVCVQVFTILESGKVFTSPGLLCI